MKTVTISLPVLGAIAATRGVLGVGAGLLLSRRLDERQRQRVGWTLFGLGVASTLPLALKVFRDG